MLSIKLKITIKPVKKTRFYKEMSYGLEILMIWYPDIDFILRIIILIYKIKGWIHKSGSITLIVKVKKFFSQKYLNCREPEINIICNDPIL